jgi:outer membrane lipoprotein-sorting protein
MNSLDRTLEMFAREEPDAAAVQEAQRKLEARLADVSSKSGTRKTRRVGGWLAATASAAAVLVAALWLPLASTTALAFSDVQKHFSDFRTLRFEMTQTIAGQQGAPIRVATNRAGDARTEIGDDLTVIVNAAEHRVLTLVHNQRIAVQHPVDSEVEDVDSLDWMEDIREFQGAATRLPQPRQIDGQTAHGWQLRVENLDIVLWATADGLPLEMQMKGSAEMRFDFRFEFDAPLPPETFSTAIPDGYSRAQAED